ncbi:MAG: hypothetical protein V2A76_12560 [Planctomycetota bacterium]
MHRVERSRVQEALHEYKKECYLIEHNSERHEDVVKEANRIVEGILDKKFHYRFHKPPNPERAEILTMIENYAREAILPPVVGSLAERIVVLEKRQVAAIECMEKLLVLFGED